MRDRIRNGLLLGLFLACGPSASQAQTDPLTLRINDTQAQPGGLVAITVRTYESRPVHQGQVCFSSQFLDGFSQPFAAFSEALVFSASGDAITTSLFDPVSQTLNLDFFSASASINSIDGPMAVIFLRLSSNLTPGDEYTLDLDPANTMLVDENNDPIALNLRSGTLEIVAPGEPLAFDADGTRAAPGSIAVLSATTQSIEPLSQGQATFRFDPSVVTQVLSASIDPRYGEGTTVLSQPQIGVAQVSFQSTSGTLNWIPGEFLTLQVRISPTAVPGTQSALTLDPAQTFLFDAQGQPLAIVSDGDVIEIVPAEEIFSDDFESGTFADWTLVVV